MVAESSPCFRALREEWHLPTAVTGPRDLAPLAREAWTCLSDLMPRV
jgi:hypothetical protein